MLAEVSGATRARPPLMLLAVSAVPALLVLLPLAVTAAEAMKSGGAAALLFRPLVGELLENTLLLIGAAALICTVIGTGAAFLVQRTDLPGRRGFAVLAATPLAVPAFIVGYAWVSLSPALEGFGGALLVVSCAYFPLVYLPVAAALRGLDPALEETARALGETPLGCVRRVILPQLRSAMLGGALLVALNSLIEFGAFALLRFRTFTTEIYAAYRTGFDGSEAALLSLILLALCLILLGAETLSRGQERYARIGRGARRPAQPYLLGVWRLPAVLAFSALVIISLGVPVLTTVYWLTQHGSAAVTPAEASPYALLMATFSTVELAAGGAALALTLALPLSILSSRWRGPTVTTLERGAWLAQGAPGIVIALALISATVRAVPALYESTLLLLVAYAILFLPLALVGVRAALLQAERQLEEAGRVLGAGWLKVVFSITLPIAAPGLGAAAALVFIAVASELTATLLLAPIGTETLATRIWSDTSTLAFAAAAPYAAILIALSTAASWLLARRFAVLHTGIGG